MPATEQTWRDQKLLHKVFAVSGLVMLVSTIWMFAEDHDREWKDYQRTFRHMEVVNTQWQEIKAQAELNRQDHERLQYDLLVAQSSRPEKELIDRFEQQLRLDLEMRELPVPEYLTDPGVTSPYDESWQEIPQPPAEGWEDRDAEIAWRRQAKQKRDELIGLLASAVADAAFREEFLAEQRKIQSSVYDAAKSDVDLAVRDNKPVEPMQEQADQVKAELEKLTAQYQQAADHREQLQKILGQINAAPRNLQKQIEENMAELEQLATGLDERQARWFEGWWFGKKWLEVPILDAFNSPLKIDNLWTDGLTHNQYNFKAVLRYDRCTTCHQAMEKTQKGTAGQPAYEPVHELTFRLNSPNDKEIAQLRGADAAQPLTLKSVYGLDLAAEGLLDRDAVTINFVQHGSPAAQTTMLDDEEGVRYLSRQIIEQSVSAALPEDEPPTEYGLMPGDVMLQINGSKVLSEADVRRMLLETIEWGQPVQLTIRRGYPHPYVTHPRLDLYVGSTSPHKLQVLGCTVCHEGQGSATAFKWASHYPNTVKERTEWRKEHGWFDNHHWIFPMYPKRFQEATCLKCHHEVIELEPSERFPDPPAPTLMAGYNTVRRYGCYGCHEIVGWNGPDERVGPDLRLEPNYFAAGLQIAHLASQRQEQLKQRRAELADLVADGEEEVQTELESVDASLQRLVQAQQLGQELGARTYDDEARRRLKEIIDHDENERDRTEAAMAAGEELDEPFIPTFTPDFYNVASVLQDEETPGKYRKVGPSLRYVASKIGREFIDDWIREPKNFRPSTRMPQFFGLHKHLPDDQIAHTEKLEKIEVQGMRSYLLKYSQPYQLVEGDREAALKPGDAERGKLLFEVGGCLACHSNSDFPGHGDQGPDLSDLGSKFTGEEGRLWLYGWIENPKRYHARTRMPIVPLKPLPVQTAEGEEPPVTDPIADVVEYLLSDTAADWQPAWTEDEVNTERLNELALEHLAKTFYEADARTYLEEGIPELRRSELKGAEVELLVAEELIAEGRQLSQEQKLLYIGSKTISKYGCFACHDIPGFEDAKPIGTALSDWGRKDPSKLAFEHIDHYVGHGGAHGDANGNHNGHSGHNGTGDNGTGDNGTGDNGTGDNGTGDNAEHGATMDREDEAFYSLELHHHSRIGFIHQKLKEPRSYDYEKTHQKPYNDRLRMPLFPLTHEQHEQAITFVLGLVADPPNDQFIYHPGPRQSAINEGRRVLDKFNCGGCHQLESEEWQLSIAEDYVERFSGPPEPATFPFMIPHVTEEQLEASEELTRSGRLPATIAGRVKRKGNGAVEAYVYDPEELDYLSLIELDADEFPAERLGYRFELYEPTLINGEQYLPKDALPIIPAKMVQHRNTGRGGDLADYLMPRVLEISGQDKGEEAWAWVPPSLVDEGKKVQPDWLHSFLLDPYPIRPAVLLNMPKFNMSPDEATKLVNYFAAKDNAVYPYKFEQRTRSDHLAEAARQYRRAVEHLSPEQQELYSGNRFEDAMRIVTSTAGCVKCHSLGDYESAGDPLAKGPNLTRVYRRLRPDYVRRWVAKPNQILPYTAMPENFKYSPQNPEQDGFAVKNLYHGTSTEQLDAVIDVLMNFDRYAEGRTSIASLVPETPPPAEAEAATGAAESTSGSE